MDADCASVFHEGLEGVEAGIVRWPASVVRLRSRDRSATLAEAALSLLDAWRPFTFEECGIKAFSLVPDDGPEGVPGVLQVPPGLACVSSNTTRRIPSCGARTTTT